MDAVSDRVDKQIAGTGMPVTRELVHSWFGGDDRIRTGE
jgi:hypothetical protein